MNGKIRAKCIKENKYGLVIGKIYDAYIIRSSIKDKVNIISVVDNFGDEYAYPSDLFEIVD